MEKLRDSLWAKVVAGMLLSICVFLTLATGLMAAGIYYECGYIPTSKEETKEKIIENLLDTTYEDMIKSYYGAVLDDEEYMVNWSKNRFTKDNCNLSFTVTGLTSKGDVDDSMPVLSNYEMNDSSYHKTELSFVEYGYDETELRLGISIDNILLYLARENNIDIIVGDTENGDKLRVYTYGYDNAVNAPTSDTQTTESTVVYDGEYEVSGSGEFYAVASYDENGSVVDVYSDDWTIYDEYDEDDITVFGEGDYRSPDRDSILFYGNPEIYVTDEIDDTIGVYMYELPETYSFSSISTIGRQVYEAYNELCDDNDYCEYETYYDESTEEIVVWFSTYKDALVSIDMKLAKNLTANDEFLSSWKLQVVDVFYSIGIPLFIVSLLMSIVLTIFLVLAAGHRRGEEDIVTNRFDRIPLDLLIVVIPAAVAAIYYIVYDGGYFSAVDKTICMAALVCIVIGLLILLPVYINTIATRAKTDTLLKNTVIWRLVKLIWKALCLVCLKLEAVVKYIIRNMNLLWKYILAFVGVSFIELFVYIFCWNSADSGLMFVCFALFKTVIFVFFLKALVDMNQLKKAGVQLAGGNADYKVDTDKMYWEFKKHGNELNCIGDGIHKAVEERLKSERMKTELITNVSHDIKTPLTSIINYVDLLEKEDIQGEKTGEYIEVLDRQSNRLKKLIEDLIEASKASTGNMNVTLETVDAGIMLGQAIGEFQDRLSARHLKVVERNRAEHTNVTADGKLLWRCLANVFSNLCKYSEEHTRVYIDTENVDDGRRLAIIIKNISKDELNISGDELMERFVRGDSSRNTEGSGLGLSIAQSLMELMNGELKIVVDGDLFKVTLILDVNV